MPGYSYDIFLSVKRDETFGEWVRQIFIPLLEAYLRQDVIVECKRPLLNRIYFYERNLQPGDIWPEELQSAIRSSRLAIALCSPEYFFSKWCLTEFYSFHHRGKVLVPVSIYDGEAFPDDVKRIQAADLSDYVIVGEGFRRTDRFVLLQDKLRMLSRQVAKLLSQVPEYTEWPVIERFPPGEGPAISLQTLGS